jgi:quinoprotein relay system zinc metallohydrolase 2
MHGALSISRRQAVAGLGATCLDALSQAAISESVAVDEIAPGVFFRFGVHEETSATNRGAIANSGFVVGRDAIAVIDPGGSLEDGRRLRDAIRRVTGLPIPYVVMTHGHPDHVFGAGAFRQDAPNFVGHHRLPSMLAARGEFYRRRLEETLGKREAGPIVMPTMLVQGRMDLDLGSRTLRLTAHPPAHTDCDLSVRDLATDTLMLGDLLFVHRVPSLDGSLRGWVRELQLLRAQRIKAAVPGHGPTRVTWPQAAEPLERYLGKLLSETREAIRRGVELDEAVSTIALSERGQWQLFDEYNGHNITQAYKELEWESSPGDPSR